MADTLTREQNAQKYGYDATVFQKDRLKDGDLNERGAFRTSFINAAKLVYQMHNGAAPSMSDNDLIKWTLAYQRDYDNQTLGFGGRGSIMTKQKLEGANEATRAAFRYVHDVYTLYDDAFLKQVGSALTDGLNLITAPLGGLASAGAKTGAVKLTTVTAGRTAAFEAAVASRVATTGVSEVAARQALSMGTTTLGRVSNSLINVGIKVGSRPVLVGAISGSAIEGGFGSYVDDSFRQDAAVLMGEQADRSGSRAFGMTVLGAGFGAAGSAVFAKWLDPKMTPAMRTSPRYQSASESLVHVMPGTLSAPGTLTAAGQHQADLMNTAFVKHGITLDQIGERARKNWTDGYTTAAGVVVPGHKDPVTGNMLDQGVHMFDNYRYATDELINEAANPTTAAAASQKWTRHLPDLPAGRRSSDQWGGSYGTTYAQDIKESFRKLPTALWKAFYDPHTIDGALAPEARLVAKVVKNNYETMLRLGQKIPIWSPRLMRRFTELEMIDVNSHRYIYPVIDAVDTVIDGHLKPMFRAGAAGARGGLDDITDTKVLTARLREIGERIKNGEDAGLHATEINNILTQLPTLRNNINNRMAPMNAELAPIETALSEIPTPKSPPGQPARKTLKQARINTLQEHVEIVRAQGQNMVKGIDETVSKLTSLNSIPTKNNDFGVSLAQLADQLDGKLDDSVKKANEVLEGAHLRMKGTNLDGTLAKVEDIRKLKRSIDEQHANPHVRRLNLMPAADKTDNNENYFIFITEHWKEAFDEKTGKFMSAAQRQPNYTTTLAGHIARLYASGNEQDAIHAVRLLRYHQGLASEQIIPDDIGKHILDKLQSDYFGKQGLKVENDPHAQFWLSKVMAATLRDHAPDIGGPRDTQKWYVERAKNWIWGRMYPNSPGGQYIAAPYRSYAFTRPLLSERQEFWAYWTGRKVVPLSDVPGRQARSPAEAEVKTTIVASRFFGLWWDKKPENTNSLVHFVTGAPTIVKAPFRLATGGLFTKRGAMIYGGLAGAGVGYDLLAGNEVSWENRKDYTAYQLWETARIPGKTLWGGASGWASEWNKTGTPWNLGGVKGATTAFGTASGSVWNATLGGDQIPFTSWTIPVVPGAGNISEPSPDQQQSQDQQTTTTPGQGAGQQGLTPATAQSDEDKRKLAMEQEETRTKLRAFGKEVADLNNAIAADGRWDTMVPGAAGTPVTRAARVDELVKTQQELNASIKRLGLGSYAEAIDADAFNTLNIQLVPNKGRGKPAIVPTFETREQERSINVVRGLSLWHNGLIALNHEVAAEGWTDARRARIKQLETDRSAFYKNVPFLGEQYRQMEKDGYVWQQALLGASTATDAAYGRVQKVEAQPVPVPGVGGSAGTPPPNSNATVSGGTAPPPGSTDPVVAAQQAAAAEAERKRIADAEAAARAAANGGTGTPGTGGTGTPGSGGTGAPAAGGGSGGGMGEAWDRMTGSFMNMTKVDGNDEVSNFVGASGSFLGAAASSGASWLGNTFTYLKNKPGGGGRALLREAGAGITAIFASAAFISPFLDKIGIGKIPLIGSIAKLAALVLVFMVARKGFDTVMDPAPPALPATGVTQTGPGTHFPRLAQGEVVQGQPHAGGTPERYVIGDLEDKDMYKEITAERGADGKAVLQLRSDSGQVFVSLGVTDATAIQSVGNRYVNVPADRLGAGAGKVGAMQFDAVTHDKVGADSFIATIDGKNHVFALQGQKYDELSIDR